MHEPTPPHPTATPKAVPWTPDMAPVHPAPAPQVAAPRPAVPQPVTPQAAPYVPPTTHAAPAPQAYQAPVAAPVQPAPVQTAPAHPAPTHAAPIPPQRQPAPQQIYQQPHQPVPHQPAPHQHVPPQNMPPQHMPPQQGHAGQYMPPVQSPHVAQIAPPPYTHGLEGHSQEHSPLAPKTSKSLLAKLLKRSPKPRAIHSEVVNTPSIKSSSLINKNFILGGAVGFIGAFALMMALGMFGVETPQSYAANKTAPASDIAAPQEAQTSQSLIAQGEATQSRRDSTASSAANSDTFSDYAIADNTP